MISQTGACSYRRQSKRELIDVKRKNAFVLIQKDHQWFTGHCEPPKVRDKKNSDKLDLAMTLLFCPKHLQSTRENEMLSSETKH
ncbi:MAG: hypothetical protein AMK69_18630 [Nitrospira bacterium SG8_3]|nr:MAG: hypothetical protein AMK69_18630 [Nitrospira bacterium SG8_3]